MSVALEKVLEKIQDPNRVNWMTCCQSAVDNLSQFPMGVKPLKSEQEVRQCYIDFRQNGRRINVPSVSMANLKIEKLPPFLTTYLELKGAIIEFCDMNIGDLTIDGAHSYINQCSSKLVEYDFVFSNTTTQADEDSDNECKFRSDNESVSDANLSKSDEELQSEFRNLAKQQFASTEEVPVHAPSPPAASRYQTPSRPANIQSMSESREKQLILKGLVTPEGDTKDMRHHYINLQ